MLAMALLKQFLDQTDGHNGSEEQSPKPREEVSNEVGKV
jgi:hypothetical protein